MLCISATVPARAVSPTACYNIGVASTDTPGPCFGAEPLHLGAASPILIYVEQLAVSKQAGLEAARFDLQAECQPLAFVDVTQLPATVLRGPLHGGLAAGEHAPHGGWLDLLGALLAEAACNVWGCVPTYGSSPGLLALGLAECGWPATAGCILPVWVGFQALCCPALDGGLVTVMLLYESPISSARIPFCCELLALVDR